jgi:hypothetical protein
MMMALRFLLVGLVASMGFEMPSARDVESWTRSGRNWVEARLSDANSLRLEVARVLDRASDCERAEPPAPAPEVEVASIRDDLTFDAVVDGMARDFVVDLASIKEPGPVDEAIAIVEPFREMPEATPTPTPSRPESPAIETVVAAPSEPVEGPATVPAAAPTSSRIEKISTALRLTRQAMSAWAALMEPPIVQLAGEEQTDTF